MCGIAGFVGIQNHKTIQNMSKAIRHRGEDDYGYYQSSNKNITLIHTRLSIVDISGGRQPMWNEDKSICLIFNGEIYNHQDLRDVLIEKNHNFKSNHSDTEVLIHAYEEWGQDMLLKLNGMFSFCIYNKKTNELFFARDRFGEKPLYYTSFNGQFAFSSELKSLLMHPSIEKKICPLSLQKYFAYNFIPAPLSLYKNIYKLPAGYCMTYKIDQKKLNIKKYWEFNIIANEKYKKISENDIKSELLHLLKESVKKRMIADVPIGIFLSGGIDSSTILAMASTINTNQKIKTFSIGFKEKSYDESWNSRKIADYFKTEHFEKIFNTSAIKELSNKVLNKLDEPIGDNSILPTFLLCKFARKFVKVALSGDGGDELFAGYAPFKALKMAHLYAKFLPKKIKEFILSQVNRLPVSENYLALDFKLKRTLAPLTYSQEVWNPMWLAPLNYNEISELFNTKISIEELYSEAIQSWQNSKAEDMISKTSEFYTKFYLQNGVLTKVDRASMMAGIEVRSPFLDNEIVSFAQKLPSKYKYNKGVTKYILKKTMMNILPKFTLKQSKKGFGTPLASWFKKNKILLNNYTNADIHVTKRLYNEHKLGYKDNKIFLWAWEVMQNHFKYLK
jgi:asparagine synthase (glutamine-hydrolysing)